MSLRTSTPASHLRLSVCFSSQGSIGVLYSKTRHKKSGGAVKTSGEMEGLSAEEQPPVPVLLLKTQSAPGDSYHDQLTAARLPNGRRLAPIFVPVMLHQFDDAGLTLLRGLLRDQKISRHPDAAYGGLIFTSQRAVEAFTHAVNTGQSSSHLADFPIYSVGPATTRALRAVRQDSLLQVSGEHTGTGEALAHYILDDYGARYAGCPTKPPLLFLVGEQRRDIIPRTLMDPVLAADRRIEVTERVIYGTGVMESFPADFGRRLEEAAAIPRVPSVLPSRWVVVFSPTGCDSMLRGLGLLDEAGKVAPGRRDGTTFIATIGPTTRDFLIDTFGFHPDVCAAKPSPEGVLEGIAEFEAQLIS
ncbi:Tetrapyrrole biosynthesis, uroporphyrinogen III synthase [Cordyceps militaris CM01]|uniref:Tetrapyrrole biosynthesis, uroporphyrinogen III synthase n=2 Tax=Cordyceps militaris TaxID=73501 RepID=G3J3V1_CORMM|nr:Tetrapyrrole biosynthesis, uroporphyrinogen III synthase [Cordyceps militaris CM01]EGX96576.1 Tetrapyrrole biosynthesis, uroporphyrinogen III synthase [Cordyceps militaris CM01]